MKSHDFIFVSENVMPVVVCSIVIPLKLIAVLSASLSRWAAIKCPLV